MLLYFLREGISLNVHGVHGHFVHEEDGVPLVVEDVIHKGPKGGPLDSVVSGYRAQSPRFADAEDRLGLFKDIESDLPQVVFVGRSTTRGRFSIDLDGDGLSNLGRD